MRNENKNFRIGAGQSNVWNIWKIVLLIARFKNFYNVLRGTKIKWAGEGFCTLGTKHLCTIISLRNHSTRHCFCTHQI